MAALAKIVRIPLSADESLTTDHSMIKIVETRAASIIQTKTGKNGGIHRTRHLWTIAHAAGVAIFPGNHPGTTIQTAAVAHLCGAWPHRTLVGDFQMFATDEIAEDVVTNPAKVENGYLPVFNGPGLGVELDEDRIKHLRLDV
jgi:muconate cycloisomerase